MKSDYTFYIYILTNAKKTVLYIGMTNSLTRRLDEHYLKENPDSFSAKYNCHHLIYYEIYQYVYDAMARETQLKKWSRKKKEALINSKNPGWRSMNSNFVYSEE